MRPNRPATRSLLLALLVVVGMTVPAMALSTSTAETATSATTEAEALQTAAQNDSNVNVTVGQQLATVITVSSDEVHTEFENTAFELSVEGVGDEEQAEAIAERADELRDRAEAIRDDYEDATEAYEDGEITKSEYAQRLASLNARASNLLTSYERLNQRAQNVSGLELRAAGADLPSLNAALENLSVVTGVGAKAILKRFTGESVGEIELETAGGLSIEVASEDGEQSREFERPRDEDNNITVSQADALGTARSALSTPENGSWVLVESAIEESDGAYAFAFVLRNAPELRGEAEVNVDGSTGEIFALEEEIEVRDTDDDDDDERDAEDEEGELALVIADGSPAPGATVTLLVLVDGEPVEGATVLMNGEPVGTTDANGTDQFTLPSSGDVEFTVEHGDAEGELEFEFEADDEDDEVVKKLGVDATLDGDTVTVIVKYDSSPVKNATVFVDGDPRGTTDASGSVTFEIDANETEELELEIVKGAFEAELEFVIEDGSLELVEAAHEGSDEAEDESEPEEEDDEDDDVEEEDESEEEETETETVDDDR